MSDFQDFNWGNDSAGHPTPHLNHNPRFYPKSAYENSDQSDQGNDPPLNMQVQVVNIYTSLELSNIPPTFNSIQELYEDPLDYQALYNVIREFDTAGLEQSDLKWLENCKSILSQIVEG